MLTLKDTFPMRTPKYFNDSTMGMPKRSCLPWATSIWPCSDRVSVRLTTMPNLIRLRPCPENLEKTFMVSWTLLSVWTTFDPSIVNYATQIVRVHKRRNVGHIGQQMPNKRYGEGKKDRGERVSLLYACFWEETHCLYYPPTHTKLVGRA